MRRTIARELTCCDFIEEFESIRKISDSKIWETLVAERRPALTLTCPEVSAGLLVNILFTTGDRA